jgi:carbon-monoxide dehydrogenase medium subunit
VVGKILSILTGVNPKFKDYRKVPPSCAPPDPMPNWKHFYIPTSLESAFKVLKEAPGTSRFVAGGTDLLLELAQGHQSLADNLIDLTQIPDLQKLEIQQGCLIIGASVPLSTIASSEIVLRNAAALHDACRLVGGPQVRNVATLGGNVCHALPAADGMIALMSLQPVVKVASPIGFREMDIQSIFKGPGQSTLSPGEIVTEFVVPLGNFVASSAFNRVMRPQGVALPILNLAIWLVRDGNRIQNCRIAVGPAGPVPILCTLAANKLIGKEPSIKGLEEAGKAVLEQVQYRNSPRRATAEYRKHITHRLFCDVFESAWTRSWN